MTEQWRPVPNYEGYYEVSDLGRVRSIRRTLTASDGITRTFKGRDLQLKLNADGYPVARLTRDGITRDYLAHRLVTLAFVGPCLDGQEVRHLDGNPGNANLLNLAYGTRLENVQDSLRHETHHAASKTHCKWGHPYDEANTYVPPRGKTRRFCRACARNRQTQSVQRQRDATARIAS